MAEQQTQDVSTESLSDSEQLANARRKPAKLAMAKKNAATEAADDAEAMEAAGSTTVRGRRMVPVHQSRIADRPPKKGEKDSSLKIKIELDLEVEVQIYARVKGDVTIGLM